MLPPTILNYGIDFMIHKNMNEGLILSLLGFNQPKFKSS